MTNSYRSYVSHLDEKTLLDLVEQSFSVNGLQASGARQILDNLYKQAAEPQAATLLPPQQQPGELKVYLTHDIDWLDPWHPYSIIKSLLPGSKWPSLAQLFNRRVFIGNIEKLLQFENNHGVSSIFLCGATHSSTYGRYDLRYRHNSPLLKKVVSMLLNSGCEVGLHSESLRNLTQQHRSLEGITARPVLYHRSHFLRYDPLQLYPTLHERKVCVDFSLGQARTPGFSGAATRHFKAIDLLKQQLTHVTVVPTVLFDNAFFFNKPEEVMTQFRNVLVQARQNNSAVAILFHPENMLIDPQLWEYYAEIIHICKTENATFNPIPYTL